MSEIVKEIIMILKSDPKQARNFIQQITIIQSDQTLRFIALPYETRLDIGMSWLETLTQTSNVIFVNVLKNIKSKKKISWNLDVVLRESISEYIFGNLDEMGFIDSVDSVDIEVDILQKRFNITYDKFILNYKFEDHPMIYDSILTLFESTYKNLVGHDKKPNVLYLLVILTVIFSIYTQFHNKHIPMDFSNSESFGLITKLVPLATSDNTLDDEVNPLLCIGKTAKGAPCKLNVKNIGDKCRHHK